VPNAALDRGRSLDHLLLEKIGAPESLSQEQNDQRNWSARADLLAAWKKELMSRDQPFIPGRVCSLEGM
jgi:hypothetical protein